MRCTQDDVSIADGNVKFTVVHRCKRIEFVIDSDTNQEPTKFFNEWKWNNTERARYSCSVILEVIALNPNP